MKLSTGERGDDICHDTISHNLFLKQIKCKLFNCCGTKSQTTISLLLPVELDREFTNYWSIELTRSRERMIFSNIYLLILSSSNSWNNEREKWKKEEEGETKRSNHLLFHFVRIYIDLYISHFALIFLTKNCTVFTIGIVFYISFIRTFIAHFPTVNRSFVPLPFLSYSSSSLPPLSFFSLWCKFSVFSYRKWSTREKRERKLCTIEHNVRWCRRKSGFLFEIDFSISENSRNIAISFFIAVQRSDSFEKLNSYR